MAESICLCTLCYITNNRNNLLIRINVLEYASLIINFVAATRHFQKTLIQPFHTPSCFFMPITPQQKHGLRRLANNYTLDVLWGTLNAYSWLTILLESMQYMSPTRQMRLLIEFCATSQILMSFLTLSHAGFSPAEILQTFSPECQAYLASYGHIIARELCWSSRSKQACTSQSRKTTS